jgi:hypothetical protein
VLAARNPLLGALHVVALNAAWAQMQRERKSKFVTTHAKAVYLALALSSAPEEAEAFNSQTPGFRMLHVPGRRERIDIAAAALLAKEARGQLARGPGSYEWTAEIGRPAAFLAVAAATIADPSADARLKAHLKALVAELKMGGAAAERATTAFVQRYGGESGDVLARLIKHWLATSGTALGCPMMTWLKAHAAALGVTFSFVQSAGLPEMMALMGEVEGLSARQA